MATGSVEVDGADAGSVYRGALHAVDRKGRNGTEGFEVRPYGRNVAGGATIENEWFVSKVKGRLSGSGKGRRCRGIVLLIDWLRICGPIDGSLRRIGHSEEGMVFIGFRDCVDRRVESGIGRLGRKGGITDGGGGNGGEILDAVDHERRRRGGGRRSGSGRWGWRRSGRGKSCDVGDLSGLLSTRRTRCLGRSGALGRYGVF